jgi:hypothetical protein
VKFHCAGFFKELKAFNGGLDFHAIIGGGDFAAGEVFLDLSVAKDGGPAARAGIAFAGAVGIDDDVFQCVFLDRNCDDLWRHERTGARLLIF